MFIYSTVSFVLLKILYTSWQNCTVENHFSFSREPQWYTWSYVGAAFVEIMLLLVATRVFAHEPP